MNNNNNGNNRFYYTHLVAPLNPTNFANPYLNAVPVLTPSPQYPLDVSSPSSSNANPDYIASKSKKRKLIAQIDVKHPSPTCSHERSPIKQHEPHSDKRRRRTSSADPNISKSKTSNASLTASKPENNLDTEEEDVRSKNLERNRLAASKCRQRKKEWLDKLTSKAERLSRENEHLRQLLLQLREETIYLKTQLMMHEKSCEKTMYFSNPY